MLRRAGLTKNEIQTAEEAKDDMGGIIRLESVNRKFAHKIQGLLGSIQSKLDNAQDPRDDLLLPETPTADEILEGIQPTDDKNWDKLLSQLDDKISSNRYHRRSEQGSMEDEARYENAFRKAFDPLMRQRSRRQPAEY